VIDVNRRKVILRYYVISCGRWLFRSLKGRTFPNRLLPLSLKRSIERWLFEAGAKKLDWRKRVQLHYEWDKPDDPQVYSKICTDFSEEEFEAYNASTVWQLNPSQDDIVLDIGCGIGRVEKFLAPQVREVWGVDFAPAMIAKAKERLGNLPNCHFAVNDGETLSMFPDEMFDIAFADLVFIHVPPEVIRSYVREVHRVLKLGGRFVCQIRRESKYRDLDRVLTGWMNEQEVLDLFREFSQVDLQPGEGGEHYYVPLAVK
jgi:ubiquinone/menaquinone biosynthesis C-methylase UbiE